MSDNRLTPAQRLPYTADHVMWWAKAYAGRTYQSEDIVKSLLRLTDDLRNAPAIAYLLQQRDSKALDQITDMIRDNLKTFESNIDIRIEISKEIKP